jgi:hypothetical protein
MPKGNRKSEIQRRQTRRRRLADLRKRYTAARTEGERKRVIDKLKRVSPWLTVEEFLAPTAKQ